ncbi:MAG: hypothetical protein VXY77_00735 [Pseudomonadota bacterium]|nr:hypothetical protein [Pseudomonadota bacterium]
MTRKPLKQSRELRKLESYNKHGLKDSIETTGRYRRHDQKLSELVFSLTDDQIKTIFSEAGIDDPHKFIIDFIDDASKLEADGTRKNSPK